MALVENTAPGQRPDSYLNRQLAKLPRIPIPLVGALLILGALITVVSWAVSSPPGSSPDEDFHLGSIWCPRPAGEFCEVTTLEDGNLAIYIPFQMAHANCNAPVPELSAACYDILEGWGNTWSVRFDDGYYPVVFYQAMHLMTNVGHNLASSVFTMRIVNGTLSVLLLATAAWLFSHQNRRLMAYALFAVLAPMALYLIISINPSGWGIVGVTLAWLGVHGFVTEQKNWRSWGLIVIGAIGAAMAASARGDTGMFVVLAALAATVLHWQRFRANWVKLLAPIIIAAIGLVGFITSGQVSAAAGGLAETGPGGYLLDNTLNLPTFLIDTIAGPLNWLDTALPGISRIPIVMLVGAIAFIGMRKMDLPKALALIGLFFSLTALPLILLEISGQPLGLYVQARYLTPIVPLIMLTALWNPHTGKVQRFSPPQLWVIWAILAMGHAWALHTQILRFTHGLSIRWWNLNTAPEWWAFGISPMTTWILGSLGFALMLFGLFAVTGRRHYYDDAVATPIHDIAPMELIEVDETATFSPFYAPIARPVHLGGDEVPAWKA